MCVNCESIQLLCKTTVEKNKNIASVEKEQPVGQELDKQLKADLYQLRVISRVTSVYCDNAFLSILSCPLSLESIVMKAMSSSSTLQ